MQINKFSLWASIFMISGCVDPASILLAQTDTSLNRFSNSEELHTDWVKSTDPLVVKVAPADGAVLKQNPPGFSWSRVPQKNVTGYEVLARSSSGKTYTWSTPRNWLLLTSALPTGNYAWKVRPILKSGIGNWSDERQFTVSSSTSSFLVPNDETLIQRIQARPHPRALYISSDGEALWRRKVLSERSNAVAQLEKEVDKNLSMPLLTDAAMRFVPRSQNQQAWADSIAFIHSRVDRECRQLRAAALLWRITHKNTYLKEAVRRGNGLSELDIDGATSYTNQDQAARNIAWSLTLAFDYLANDLPEVEGETWLKNIQARTNEIHRDLVSSGWRLEETPFDSHGSTVLGYLTGISTLLIGDVDESKQWFKDSFRSYVQYISPWGGADGGFANGSAYGEYSADPFVQLWDPILAATGVNLYEKPWSLGFMHFLMSFVPPGSPIHEFGDGEETQPDFALIKAYVDRFANIDAAWYAKNITRNEDPLKLLAAPIPLPVETVQPVAPKSNAYVFPSIGWAAMHSDLTDPDRTSIYFKSSPFGSYNHSHGDENAFSIVAGKQPLLTSSGYYDWYGSPHWKQWYRQTKAKNAITYDDGVGQIIDGSPSTLMKANGKLTAFQTGANIDMVEGDATPAYGGALSKAIRKLWYIRNLDAVVVWDKLQSSVPRIFEWNVHALSKFEQIDPKSIYVRTKGQSACIRTIWPENVSYTQTNGYPVMPSGASGLRDKNVFWHVQIKSKLPQKDVEFLNVISVNCSGNIKFHVAWDAAKHVLSIDKYSLKLIDK